MRASSARLVAAADAERRRLERDLHDGAQQRLVSLALTLRLARAPRRRASWPSCSTRRPPSSSRPRTSCASSRAASTPPCSPTAAWAPAIARWPPAPPVPVTVDGVPDERLPAAVESAAYFLVAEALTNVARYARGVGGDGRRASAATGT